MSHEPPVPPGNQSPFPTHAAPQASDAESPPPLPVTPPVLVPPAIVAATTPLAPAPVTVAPRGTSTPPAATKPASSSVPLGRIVGAAAGAGALVFGIAALLFPRAQATSAKRPAKGKRRKK